MDARTFLQELLPANGRYAVAAINPTAKKGSDIYHKYSENLDELIEFAQQEQTRTNRDVYICPATFQPDSTRRQSNAVQMKSFFLDLDVGANDSDSKKPLRYESKRAAVDALSKFLEDTGLPEPTLVDSGGGVHVYWVLTEPVAVAKWFPVAKSLKELARKYKFLMDTSVPADSARLMRLVGSENIKRGRKKVSVKQWREPVVFEDFVEQVYQHVDRPAWHEQFKAEWAKRSNLANMPEQHPDKISIFKKIAIKSLNDDGGCAQIKHCLSDQAGVEEPLWRAVLSVAWVCEDSDTAIHKVSKHHPEYDPDATVAKAMATQGPYRCATFNEINPGVCEDCPHFGKMTSPVQLGASFKQLEADPEIPPTGTALMAGGQFCIPKPPRPYVRPASGGVAIELDDPKGGPPLVIMIIEQDLWVERIIKDGPTKKHTLWMRSFHPKQGLIEFVMPQCINQRSELVRNLEERGVVFSEKYAEKVQDYLYRCLKTKMNSEAATMAFDQFGWDAKYTNFVLGRYKYTKGAPPEAAIPSSFIDPLTAAFDPSGSLEGWVDAVKMLTDRGRAMYPQLTMVLAAAASPLMTFTGKAGMIYSLYSGDPGSGKTTAQLIGTAFYGNPKILFGKRKDSYNSRIQRLGAYNSINYNVDEITDWSVADRAAFCYDVSDGSSGSKAHRSGHGEVRADRSWSLMATVSSNVSYKGLIAAMTTTHNPEANLVRIIEFFAPSAGGLTKEQGDALEHAAKVHYGHGGALYIQYLVDNVDEIAAAVTSKIVELNKLVERPSRERYAIAGVACFIIGAQIWQKLGLIDVDMERYTQWLESSLADGERLTQALGSDRSAALTEYLRTYMRSCVICEKNIEGKVYVLEPDRIMQPVMMRIERHIGRLYIPVSLLRSFCVERGIDFDKSIDNAQRDGLLISTTPKNIRLMSGLTVGNVGAVTRCLEFLAEL